MKSMISTINLIVSQGSDKKEGANGKRKSRSRKGTLKKGRREVIKVEQSETPKSISEQFMTLVDTIGGLIPIPFLSNTVVGFIIVLIGF